MPSDKHLRPVMVEYYAAVADTLLAEMGGFSEVLLKHSDFTVPLMKEALQHKTKMAELFEELYVEEMDEKEEKVKEAEVQKKELEMAKKLIAQMQCGSCHYNGKMYLDTYHQSIRCSQCQRPFTG